ncbi:hypothetical protein XAP412_320022 [Xanthomonas phaseoli pv. phaseoli]|uniref:Secreted protein n=1 Tax=Xanthomonas campestris pv. phaseoli TaxID=317013 RepID=A0AB38E0T4_XANCH|nr:hypothetical protein XAP6984_380021 [Xanthomonas phaseoli pv. phaseoli]SON83753.1 hypothetical protein XAP412_320022 [Xanthomonas phaseoli pv. phaseoli]SON88215.1 hypothetical protein XAP7430_360022 [Xanthomonas phaseoli pv. phaseoli]
MCISAAVQNWPTQPVASGGRVTHISNSSRSKVGGVAGLAQRLTGRQQRQVGTAPGCYLGSAALG